MGILLEQILTYGIVLLLCIVIVIIYLRRQKYQSNIVEEKIKIAKTEGLHEPVSLHPVVDASSCIKTGACIAACPEKDILGIVNGKATTINASQCIGHGACFHACPTEAISLCIGTEKRGVELPHVSQSFETNIPGIYIAGELGGMGLIKNAVEQGKQAVENILKAKRKNKNADYDIIIVGAGPAGIAASLAAKKCNLSSVTLEQDTLGGAVYTFPRSKIVMTSAMNLPLYGKVRFYETSKSELLDLWNKVLIKNEILIKEKTKIKSIQRENGCFKVESTSGEVYHSSNVLLAIGRRGSPRKLNIKGEISENVAYRLLEPEDIKDKDILVVGGGDSAIESALLLAEQNRVVLSYRKDVFNRIKPKNNIKIKEAIKEGALKIHFNSNLIEIEKDYISLSNNENSETMRLKNDLVYIFAGGELPTQFLHNIGLKITKKYGEAILKH